MSDTSEISHAPARSGPLSPDSINNYILRLWMLAALLILIAASYCQLTIGFNNDNLTLMFQTRQMLSGAKLYVDYTDVSPPMIHLLYTIPVLLAKATGLPDYISLKLAALLLCCGSVFACHNVLKHGTLPLALRCLLLSAIAVALIALSLTFQLYADREHLMMALTMPFILLYSPVVNRAEISLRLRLIIAVMAGFGLAIKPYFYVFYIAIILCTVLRERRVLFLFREIEHYIIAAIALIYLAVVWFVFPAYIQEILPLGWYTYDVISWGWQNKFYIIQYDLLKKYGSVAFFSMAWLFVLLWYQKKRWLGYMFALMVAGIVSYALNAGWPYTQYPFIAISFIATVMITAHILLLLAREKGLGAWCKRMMAIALCLFALSYNYARPAVERAVADMNVQRHYGHPIEVKIIPWPAMRNIYPVLEKNPRFLLLSTNSWAVNWMAQVPNTLHVGRFDYLWMVPGLLSMEWRGIPPEYFIKFRNYTGDKIAEDITTRKPDIIIVDRSIVQRALPDDFDLLRFLHHSWNLTEALSHYRSGLKIDTCKKRRREDCAYEIFYRNPE